MAAISGQIAEPAGNLSRYGTESASVLTRHAQAKVTYTRVGTVYTDTIAASSAAVLWGSSPATSVVDLTKAPLVTFIVCSNGGTDTLYCTPELTFLASVCGAQDVVPLDLVDFLRIQRYQLIPINTGALGVSGGAVQGGGTYGSFNSQSIQGGGSVSGITVNITSSNDGNHAVNFGFFVKVASLPASDMSLFDFNIGANGYVRCKMTSAGHVALESTFHTVGLVVDLTPTTPLVTNTWYWVAGDWGNSSSVTQIVLAGQVWKGDGTSANGAQGATNTSSNVANAAYTGTLGWGHDLTGGYLNFPNTAGNELSKLQFSNGGLSVPTPPASDAPTTGLLALYLCRDTTGAQTTLVDSTINHFNLSGTFTVVTDGPYP